MYDSMTVFDNKDQQGNFMASKSLNTRPYNYRYIPAIVTVLTNDLMYTQYTVRIALNVSTFKNAWN